MVTRRHANRSSPGFTPPFYLRSYYHFASIVFARASQMIYERITDAVDIYILDGILRWLWWMPSPKLPVTTSLPSCHSDAIIPCSGNMLQAGAFWVKDYMLVWLAWRHLAACILLIGVSRYFSPRFKTIKSISRCHIFRWKGWGFPEKWSECFAALRFLYWHISRKIVNTAISPPAILCMKNFIWVIFY